MKKMTLKVALLATMMATSGFAVAMDEDSYRAEHKAAVEALDKAKKVGGEWRDSRWKKSTAVKVGDKKMSYLAAAEAYAAEGDYKNAMKYAGIAKFEGEMGYQQAMDQKSAGPRH